MAVLVERQQTRCPNCDEFLSFTSADARIITKDTPTTVYDAGKNIPMINTRVSWYITCPTCKKSFEAKSYNRLKKP